MLSVIGYQHINSLKTMSTKATVEMFEETHSHQLADLYGYRQMQLRDDNRRYDKCLA